MSVQQIIRVHTAEGTVYARIMEPFSFDGVVSVSLDESENITYTFIKLIDVPAGLDQQSVVDHFRSQGWIVEQDHGYYEWGV